MSASRSQAGTAGSRKRGRGFRIGDKGSDRSHPHGSQPHHSKVLVHAVRGLGAFVTDLDINGPTPLEESGAADLPGPLDQRATEQPMASTSDAHPGGRDDPGDIDDRGLARR